MDQPSESVLALPRDCPGAHGTIPPDGGDVVYCELAPEPAVALLLPDQRKQFHLQLCQKFGDRTALTSGYREEEEEEQESKPAGKEGLGALLGKLGHMF